MSIYILCYIYIRCYSRKYCLVVFWHTKEFLLCSPRSVRMTDQNVSYVRLFIVHDSSYRRSRTVLEGLCYPSIPFLRNFSYIEPSCTRMTNDQSEHSVKAVFSEIRSATSKLFQIIICVRFAIRQQIMSNSRSWLKHLRVLKYSSDITSEPGKKPVLALLSSIGCLESVFPNA